MFINFKYHFFSLVKTNSPFGFFQKGGLSFILPIFFFICFSLFNATAQETDWPNFHGLDRTNKSTETGLLKEWPKDGPALNWSVSGIGEGYSSVSIADGYIFTAGSNSGQTFVFCFDLSGKLLWKKPNGKAWSTTMSHARSYTGSRSTPTYNDGVLYHLGESGRLAAFNSKTGEEIWQRELPREFEPEPTEYGYSESVLIDGDNLYVSPFGKKGFTVCLNKNTGKLIWANTEISGIEGYSSPVIMEFAGYRQIISSSGHFYYGVDSETGKLLWKFDFENQRELNNTDAIISNEYVFISSGYGKGSVLFKLKNSEKGITPETVWQSELMDNHHGGVILDNGYLYGAGSNSRGWFCLDFLTGKQMWKTGGKGSVTFADGMLYLLDERGTMNLVRATPEKFELKGEFKVPKGGEGMYWAHPVVCNGTLYIRHADKLYAYNIKQE
ncbi:PQQ-binding-like beta-propeller repeat protein [Draconibacterium sp.]|nr:PQQ-binding-like beta-propeller repeat protein [Draconibacterium sp.]